MVATNSPNNTMKNAIISKLTELLPSVAFVEARSFYWSPKTKTVYIDSAALSTKTGKWALLHEFAHAQLGHETYANDAGLLTLEVNAWQLAEKLGLQLNCKIDPDHIQDCLDTYRDWLYARSTCPTCALNSLQIDETVYQCLNCSTRWSVSPSRFCRPYRMKDKHKKTPSELSQTV